MQSNIKAVTQSEEAADADKWGKQGLENDWGNADVSASKPDPLGKRSCKSPQECGRSKEAHGSLLLKCRSDLSSGNSTQRIRAVDSSW